MFESPKRGAEQRQEDVEYLQREISKLEEGSRLAKFLSELIQDREKGIEAHEKILPQLKANAEREARKHKVSIPSQAVANDGRKSGAAVAIR